MTFRCPACGQTYPLAAGLLVMEHTAAIQPSKRRHGVAAIAARPGGVLVAILCGRCAGRIVTDRAKVKP